MYGFACSVDLLNSDEFHLDAEILRYFDHDRKTNPIVILLNIAFCGTLAIRPLRIWPLRNGGLPEWDKCKQDKREHELSSNLIVRTATSTQFLYEKYG